MTRLPEPRLQIKATGDTLRDDSPDDSGVQRTHDRRI